MASGSRANFALWYLRCQEGVHPRSIVGAASDTSQICALVLGAERRGSRKYRKCRAGLQVSEVRQLSHSAENAYVDSLLDVSVAVPKSEEITLLHTKRPALLALSIVVAAGLGCSAPDESTTTTVAALNVDTTATYTLVGVQSGKCVDVPNGSTSTGTQLDISTCVGGSPRQQFKLDSQGNGYYHLRNVGSGLCVDVNGAATADGAAVIQWTCGTGTNQQWLFTDSNARRNGHRSPQRQAARRLGRRARRTARSCNSGPPTAASNQLFKLQIVNGAYVWKNVAIGGGGFVTGIVFSPVQSGLAYARTDVGGFYRWNGATNTWTPLTDAFPASQGNYLGGESIAADPVNANIVYAAAGHVPGQWQRRHPPFDRPGHHLDGQQHQRPMGGNENGRGMGERLAVDPNKNTILYFGSRTAGLWKSTNSGELLGPGHRLPDDAATAVTACRSWCSTSAAAPAPARTRFTSRRRPRAPAATSIEPRTAGRAGRGFRAGRRASWPTTRRSAATARCGSPIRTTTGRTTPAA